MEPILLFSSIVCSGAVTLGITATVQVLLDKKLGKKRFGFRTKAKVVSPLGMTAIEIGNMELRGTFEQWDAAFEKLNRAVFPQEYALGSYKMDAIPKANRTYGDLFVGNAILFNKERVTVMAANEVEVLLKFETTNSKTYYQKWVSRKRAEEIFKNPFGLTGNYYDDVKALANLDEAQTQFEKMWKEAVRYCRDTPGLPTIMDDQYTTESHKREMIRITNEHKRVTNWKSKQEWEKPYAQREVRLTNGDIVRRSYFDDGTTQDKVISYASDTFLKYRPEAQKKAVHSRKENQCNCYDCRVGYKKNYSASGYYSKY